jgi:hypothetical protein
MFHVINRHGLRFVMFGDNHEQVCRKVARLLGKRKLPYYISVDPAD